MYDHRRLLQRIPKEILFKIEFICTEYKKCVGEEISYEDCLKVAIESLHKEVEATGTGRIYYWLKIKKRDFYCYLNILKGFDGNGAGV